MQSLDCDELFTARWPPRRICPVHVRSYCLIVFFCYTLTARSNFSWFYFRGQKRFRRWTDQSKNCAVPRERGSFKAITIARRARYIRAVAIPFSEKKKKKEENNSEKGSGKYCFFPFSFFFFFFVLDAARATAARS